MKQIVQKVLLLVAVFTVTAHNIIPHYHHDEVSIVALHHDHEEESTANLDHPHEKTDDHHNIFSFAQLDENYVPVKCQKIPVETSIKHLVTPVIIYQLNLHQVRPKIIAGYYREFPPPDNYSPNLFSRPPPAAC